MRILVLSCAFLGVVLATSVLPAGQDKPPPPAAPVIGMLKAVKANDVSGFKNAYSKRIREDKEQGNWDKNLKEAQAGLKKLYGEYDLKEFTFTFTGDKEKGGVSITHKGKKSIDLGVIKEGKDWKIDQR